VLDDNIDTLNSDIARLIAASKNEFAQNPYDGSIQTRLKALLDLQSILGTQKLPPDQIALIKDQVKALSSASKPQLPPQPAPAPVQTPVAVSQSSPQPPSLASLLGGPNALAALLARSTAASQTPTPPPPTNVQPPRTQPSYAPPTYPPALGPVAKPPSATANPTSLLDQLRAAGLLPSEPVATGTPPIRQSPQIPQLPQIPQIPQIPTPNMFAGIFPPPPVLPGQQIPVWPGASHIPNDVQLKAASLKM
jgi:pre-mRNA cleavage complex 2 protein Pcf11